MIRLLNVLDRTLRQVLGNKRYLNDLRRLFSTEAELSHIEMRAIQYLIDDLNQLKRENNNLRSQNRRPHITFRGR